MNDERRTVNMDTSAVDAIMTVHAHIALRARPDGVTAARRATRQAASSILQHLDVDALDIQTRAESRNREVHVPAVSVYRWWARRSHSVFGALVAAAHKEKPGQLLISDPFSGGATVALQALLAGDRVYLQDINPWAVFGATQMLSLPPVGDLEHGIAEVKKALAPLIRRAYATECPTHPGTPSQVSHTLRVATGACSNCGRRARMFPYSLLSLLSRQKAEPRAWLACQNGHVFVGAATQPSSCATCGDAVDPTASYLARRIVRCECGHAESLSERASSLQWEPVLVERVCGKARHIDHPTETEVEQATDSWSGVKLGRIPNGKETQVLLRHGFKRWEDLYPSRQQHVLAKALEAISRLDLSPSTTDALRLAVLGVAEMAGHASRWDRFYLKSYESTSNHRFTFTTLSAEPNVWGTEVSGRGTILRRFRQLTRAACWLHERTPTLRVERLDADERIRPIGQQTTARIVLGSSTRQLLPTGTADLVLTDPPYHDDVQYSELSALFNAWLAAATDEPRLKQHAFEGEAVVNVTRQADTESYRLLLTEVFAEARRTLRADGHVVLTYANRNPQAWAALASAVSNSGLAVAGFQIVHSENECDFSKRDRASCQRDLVLDLVHSSTNTARIYVPKRRNEADLEEQFLHDVICWFHELPLTSEHEAEMCAALARHPFIAGRP